ncbi:MAG: hypothetical protein ACMUIP_16990 [bacterium]
MKLLKQFIPQSLKSKILTSRLWNKRWATMLASSSKRLDLCAAQFAHILHLSENPPLRDKVCLEVGSGWVLTHAIICHLLGAKRVIATDITPLVYPPCLSKAVKQSIPYIIQDILSPFLDHSEIRARLDNLLSIKRFNLDTLKKLKIEYIAPLDLAQERTRIPVDFIYSFSVLEHACIDTIQSLLNNIVIDLKSGGTMIHCIHLEDHKDIQNHPFDFLSEPHSSYTPALQHNRGNRIRRSQWYHIFNNLENIQCEFIYEWIRRDKTLPAHIDPSIIYEDEDDLKISHIGVYGIKE